MDYVLMEGEVQGRDGNDVCNAYGRGHTDSTLQSSPAGSPRSQRSISPSLASHTPSSFDRAKVDELRQVFGVDQQPQNLREQWADSSIVITEESKVSENKTTRVNRIKVQGLWLAKKVYKNSDREQVERETYLQEIKILRHLTREPHWHVILLLHGYINPIGQRCLILSPLAQMTLEVFLSQRPNQERKRLVSTWIGCLMSALAHIHAQRVKHKDIKPSNILIHGTNPIITDMGISHQFDKDSKSSGDSAGSRPYEAPEVLKRQVRGRRQDIWSMLCCYIEILAFLKDMDCKTFHKSIALTLYFYKYDLVVDWLNDLRPGAVNEEELAFIQLLLGSFKIDPNQRPYACDLVDQIQAICKHWPHKYIGECCVTEHTVSTSSNLKPAADGTQPTMPNPEKLDKGSLLHFIASTALSLGKSDIPEAGPSLATLYQQASNETICSIRSAERKFLLTIAPKLCKDGETYLALCNGFIESLSNAIESCAYMSCLYDAPLGEDNHPYTTNYFEILVGEISNRYLTYNWV